MAKYSSPFDTNTLHNYKSPFGVKKDVGSPFAKPKKDLSLEEKVKVEEERAKQYDIEVPDEKKSKFKVWDLFEWMRYPITNMIYTAVREHKEGDGLTFEDTGKILKSAMYGATLKEKRNTDEVLRMLFPEQKEWVYTVFGLAGDILTDPATYLTFGFAGGAKGAIAGKKAAEKFGKVAFKKLIKEGAEGVFAKKMISKWGGKTIEEAIQRASKSVAKNVGKYGLRVGVPFTGITTKPLIEGGRADILAKLAKGIGAPEKAIKGIKGLSTTIANLPPVKVARKLFDPSMAKGHEQKLEAFKKLSYEQEQIDDIFRGINKASKQVKKKPQEVLELIRESRDLGKKLPDELKGVNDLLQNKLDDIWNQFRKRGMVDEEKYISRYFPRYYLKADTGEFAIIKKGEPGFFKTRHFNSVQDAEEYGFKALSADESLAKYFDKATRHINSTDLIGTMLEDYAVKGAKATRGFSNVELKGLEKYVVPDEINEVLNKINKVIVEPQETQKALAFLDKVHNVWKKQATIYNPAFHLRNFMSNTWSGIFKDGVGPGQLENQVKAIKMCLTPNSPKAMSIVIDGKKVVKPIKEWYEYFRKAGVHTGKFMAAELIPTTAKAGVPGKIAKVGKAVATPYTLAGKAGMKAGSAIENSARVASAMNDLRKGISIKDATKRVNRFFLDYSDLTAFEKGLKRFVPFYCVPDDTEILTREGWKKRNKTEVGEECLTYNVEKDVCEWQEIEDIAVFDFDDKIVRAKNKTYADLRFTEDHRFPISVKKTFVKGKWYGGNRKIVRANELNKNHQLILSAPMTEQESILSPKDAAILGWLVTDGYTRWRGNHLEAVIYQSPKKHANEIRELTGDSCTESIHPETGVICFRLKAEYINNHIKPVFKSKEDLPGIVTRLSIPALKSMFDAMVKAEGSVGYKETKKEFLQFGQTKGPVLDAFQIICQLLDKPFSFKERQLNSKPICYGCVRKANKCHVMNLDFSKEHYKGKIWCPKTKNSTWIMRQNGQAICSGNTWLKKNLVNQISFALQDPGKYSAFTIKPMRAINKLTESERQYLPEYMDEGMYVNLFGEKSPTGKPVMRDLDLPFQALGEQVSFQHPFKTLLSTGLGALTPLIKTPFELAQNREVFRDLPITRGDYDLKPAPPLLSTIISGIPEEFRRKLGIIQDKTGQWMIDPKWSYALTSLVPLLKYTAGKYEKHPEAPEYKQERAPYISGGRITGMTGRPFDTEYYKKKYLQERLQKLKRLNAMRPLK